MKTTAATPLSKLELFGRRAMDACSEGQHRLEVVIEILDDHECNGKSSGWDLIIATDALRKIQTLLQKAVGDEVAGDDQGTEAE